MLIFLCMAGGVEPESAWYCVERVREWQDLFGIEEYELEIMLGPRIDRETGEWFMDVYGRYNGERDFDSSWDMTVDYSCLDDFSLEDMQCEYGVWRGFFLDEFSDADLYFSEFLR